MTPSTLLATALPCTVLLKHNLCVSGDDVAYYRHLRYVDDMDPLLVHIVCVLYRKKGSVPDEQPDLLATIVNWSIDWKAKRLAGERELEKMKEGLSELGRLAMWGLHWKQHHFGKVCQLNISFKMISPVCYFS